jgi:NADPH:quinone reductase-like Zn-dependent oxidoreductase
MRSTRQPAQQLPAPPKGELMRAIVQDTYGGADMLRMADIDKPAIAADEVLVRVHAAGVDRGTWHTMTGRPYLMRIMGFGLRGPKNRVPGLDVAGTVVAIGADVTRFTAGDEVFGVGKGSFAEYAAVREDKLAHKPPGLSFEQAAVLAVSATTALHGLRDAGRIRPGQQVLIIGASGGVGTYAVQLARAFGAQVTGVCRTDKVDLVRSIGADHVIDRTQEDFADGTRRYDLILDIGGNNSLPRLRRALTPTGTLVIAGGEEGGAWFGGIGRQLHALVLSPFLRQRLTMFIAVPGQSDLETLRELVEAGQLDPVVGNTYPLAGAPDALRHLEAGQARGKIAITI